jgi:hypothetical protein
MEKRKEIIKCEDLINKTLKKIDKIKKLKI